MRDSPNRRPGRCDPPADELRAELEFHIEERIDRLVEEGWAKTEARAEALRRFGDPDRFERELGVDRALASADRRRWARWEAFAADLRQALRHIRRNPLGSAAVFVVLMLGLSAGSLVYAIVDNVLVQRLPYGQPDRLVSIREIDSYRSNGQPELASPPAYDHWRNAAVTSFEGIAVVSQRDFELQGEAEPERLLAAAVPHDFFAIIGAPMELGRGFVPQEDVPHGPAVVVLSHALWATRYGADPDIVGKSIVLSGVATTVVGVVREGYEYPQDQRAWVPFTPLLSDGWEEMWGAKFLPLVGRLRPAASPASAAAELQAVMTRVPEAGDVGAEVVSLQQSMTAGVAEPLRLLLGAVALVMLVACANVGNILLARGLTRRREVAIRAALGAGRGRLFVTGLLEGVILAVAAAVAALVVVALGKDALLAFAPESLPRLGEIAVDWRVAGFAVAAGLATGLLAGLLPALRMLTLSHVAADLRDGGRSATGSGGAARLLSTLVVGEIAITLVLLTGAGLLGMSFYRIVSQEAGFDPDGVVTLAVSLPDSRYGSDEQLRAFYDATLARVRALPGVTSAALSTANLPASGASMTSPIARPNTPMGDNFKPVQVIATTPGYVASLGMSVVSGRDFTDADLTAPTPVVLLNEAAVRAYFPDVDPVGQMAHSFFTREFAEVVGVVNDVRLRNLTDDPPPAIYNLLANQATGSVNLVVKANLPPDMMYGPLRAAVADVDPLLPVTAMRTLEGIVSASVAQPRFYVILLGSFAALTLLLSLVGFYGVASQSVQQRLGEIGVRIALGAAPRRVAGLVLGRGLGLVAAGAVLGLAGAFGLTRLLAGLLYGVRPLDPMVLGASVGLLLVVSIGALVNPLRTALGVDPVEVLRLE